LDQDDKIITYTFWFFISQNKFLPYFAIFHSLIKIICKWYYIYGKYVSVLWQNDSDIGMLQYNIILYLSSLIQYNIDYYSIYLYLFREYYYVYRYINIIRTLNFTPIWTNVYYVDVPFLTKCCFSGWPELLLIYIVNLYCQPKICNLFSTVVHIGHGFIFK